MANTIANVLVGVATLGIRQPNDAIAEWSIEHVHNGTYAVKLAKAGATDAVSTHLQCLPTVGGVAGADITLAAWNTEMQAADNYKFWNFNDTLAGVHNWTQIEFRFEDPDSDAWVEITALPLQSIAGDGLWDEIDLGSLASNVGYYMENEDEVETNNWAHAYTVANVAAQIITEAVDTAADWVLVRVRFELWEAGTRTTFIGRDMTLHSVVYTAAPGGTLPAMSLSSPFTDVGYTEDGVTLEYTADEADIEVEEETFPINRVITKETMAVTCNMAESSLYNIDKAIAGSVLSGSILTLGDGVNKTVNLKIAGTNPAGFNREIFIPSATATGAVEMAYRKGEKTIVPVTFQVLKTTSESACTIVDNIA